MWCDHWPSRMADSSDNMPPSQWTAVKLRVAEVKTETPIAPTIEENVYSNVKLRSAPKPADYDGIETPRQEKTIDNANKSGEESFKLRNAPKPVDYVNVDCQEVKQQFKETSTNTAYEEVRARLKKVQQQQ